MAGDWIKMRTDLYRDPRVCVMAEILEDANGDLARYVSQNLQRDMTVTRNVMRNVTVGALVSVWGVMRHRGKREELDLVCRGSTLSVIDDIADLPGFGEAMADVGWAVVTDSGVVFPRFFEDYNVAPDGSSGNSNADRQRRYRERKKGEIAVTRDVTRDVTVTPREEKRREEEKSAAAPPFDFKADLFNRWKALPNSGGGAFLSKLFRDHKPEERVMEAVERCLSETRADPKAFVLGILKSPAAEKRIDGETLDEALARAI